MTSRRFFEPIENPVVETKGDYIVIELPTGKCFGVNFKPQDTVLDIKEKIYAKLGFSLDQQRLVFAGKQLENERTLSDLNIHKY